MADRHDHRDHFLIVIDDTPEMSVALRYGAHRARRTGNRVALLTVVEPMETQHFRSVEALMRQEARAAAEAKLHEHAALVHQISGMFPVVYIREGRPTEEVLRVVEEEPIAILILGAKTSGDNPGPLIRHVTGRGLSSVKVPVTIVPDTLTPQDIARLI